MKCYINEEKGSQQVVLIFRREDLLYDITNGSYVEGTVMAPETPPHNRHMVQDVADDGNVDLVVRALDLGVAKCREMLYPFTKSEITSEVLDSRLRDRDVYGIVMEVPLTFSQTTLQYLEQLILQYLVCKGTAKWMSLTNPGRYEVWEMQATDAEREIKTSINSRMTGTFTRRMSVF